jgi:hypothetical protein
MRFYPTQHHYSRGVDLHARSLFGCILDRAGEKQLHRKCQRPPKPSSTRCGPTPRFPYCAPSALAVY